MTGGQDTAPENTGAGGPVVGNITPGGHDFDPDDPAGLADPEGLYGRLRERCPVAHSGHYGGFWAVTRYRDVQRVMRDPATFSSGKGIVIPRNPASGRRPPLHYDPPEHTAYRRVISPVFRRERLGWLAPAVAALAENVVSQLPRECELYGDFCSPYAARVVCLLLNIPDDLTGQFAVHMDAVRGRAAPPRRAGDRGGEPGPVRAVPRGGRPPGRAAA